MHVDRTTVALVTGAAGGIGAATAERLHREGTTVITADLNGAEVALDVTDLASVRATVDDAVDSHVADAIVTGIRRNRAVVTPKRARVLHLAARLSPGVTERVLSHFMKRELAHR